MIAATLSTLAQVGFVLLLALAGWGFAGRKRGAFRDFCGLKAAPWSAALAGVALGVATAVATLQLPGVRELAGGDNSVVASVIGPNRIEIFFVLALTAVVKTAFSEELLFRGLIGKRLISAIGFGLGNSVQALIFGAAHLLLFLVPSADKNTVLLIVAMTTTTGWINGWLNERLGRGSIMPGWAAHATANLIAYFSLAGVWVSS